MARYQCSSCGMVYEREGNFCVACGHPLSEIPEDTPEGGANSAAPPKPPAVGPIKYILIGICAVCVLAAFVCVGIFALLTIGQSNTQETGAAEPSAQQAPDAFARQTLPDEIIRATQTPREAASVFTRAPVSDNSTGGASTPAASPEPSSVPPARATISVDAVKSESASNANNNGLFAYHGDWLYVRTGRYMESANSTYGLYRIPAGGGEAQLVYDGPNWYTNVDDGAVYFVDHQRGRMLLRLDLRTGETAVLADFGVRRALLAGDYVYGAKDGGGLFRVKKDGSEPPETFSALSNTIISLSESNGILYFVDESAQKLFSLDGVSLRSHFDQVKKAIVQGETVYYVNTQNQLCASSLDGASTRRLIEEQIGSFVVSDGVIYYTNENRGSHIYAVGADGGQPWLVCGKPATGLSILDRWLFFINTENDTASSNDEFYLWCVRTDGTSSQSLEQWMQSMR